MAEKKFTKSADIKAEEPKKPRKKREPKVEQEPLVDMVVAEEPKVAEPVVEEPQATRYKVIAPNGLNLRKVAPEKYTKTFGVGNVLTVMQSGDFFYSEKSIVLWHYGYTVKNGDKLYGWACGNNGIWLKKE